MPKNSKKEKIKEAIIKDEKTLVDIAREFGVQQPYISQLKKEVEYEENIELLKFMYNIMNNKMIFRDGMKLNDNEKEKINKVRNIA